MHYVCKLDRCGLPIITPPGGRRKLFCCDDHVAIGKANSIVKFRAKKQSKEAVACKNKKCHRLFVKQYIEHVLCHACERAGVVVKKDVGQIAEPKESGPANDMNPQTHIDFRSKICNRGKWNGGLCKHYSKCSDSLGTSRHGAFKYQLNGGVDCWKKDDSGVNRTNYGSTSAVHRVCPFRK